MSPNEIIMERNNPAAIIRVNNYKQKYYEADDEEPIYNLDRSELTKEILDNFTEPLVIGSNSFLLDFFKSRRIKIPEQWIRRILIPKQAFNQPIEIFRSTPEEILKRVKTGEAFSVYPKQWEEPSPFTLTETTFKYHEDSIDNECIYTTHIRKSYICNVWLTGDLIEHVHLDRYIGKEMPDLGSLPEQIKKIRQQELRELEFVFLRLFTIANQEPVLIPEQIMSSLFAPPIPNSEDYYSYCERILEDVMEGAEMIKNW